MPFRARRLGRDASSAQESTRAIFGERDEWIKHGVGGIGGTDGERPGKRRVAWAPRPVGSRNGNTTPPRPHHVGEARCRVHTGERPPDSCLDMTLRMASQGLDPPRPGPRLPRQDARRPAQPTPAEGRRQPQTAACPPREHHSPAHRGSRSRQPRALEHLWSPCTVRSPGSGRSQNRKLYCNFTDILVSWAVNRRLPESSLIQP